MDNRTNTIAGWVLGGMRRGAGAFDRERHGVPLRTAREDGLSDRGRRAEGGEAAPPPKCRSRRCSPAADPAKGAEVFKKCAACHTINQGGANGIGPNLYAHRRRGDRPGQGRLRLFRRAQGASAATGISTALNAWLTSPRNFASGTKMTFAGLSNAAGPRECDRLSQRAGLEPAAAGGACRRGRAARSEPMPRQAMSHAAERQRHADGITRRRSQPTAAPRSAGRAPGGGRSCGAG